MSLLDLIFGEGCVRSHMTSVYPLKGSVGFGQTLRHFTLGQHKRVRVSHTHSPMLTALDITDDHLLVSMWTLDLKDHFTFSSFSIR